MRRRWREPASWPLRTRLVAAMTALLTLVCLLIGAATGIVLHRVLMDRLDQQLADAASPSPRGQRGGRAPDAFRGHQVGTVQGFFAEGRPPRATYLAGFTVPDRVLSAADTELLANVPADRTARSYELELGSYRVMATRVGRDKFVTGLPLAPVRGVLYRVVGIEVLLTVAALTVAGWAGALIVRRNLRPLDRMAATAGRVAELRLDRGEVALAERVPDVDTDPGTEVGQVGAALNRMLGHVAGALTARHASETQVRQFVADASHELRTPLAAIRGYAELTRRSREPVPPDVAHALLRVESEAQRMTALVEDMLLLARLDAGRPLARQPVDLAPLVVDAVSDAHAAGPEHHWRLDLPDEPVSVLGDQARLHQVIANLLSNARTHTAAGTTVTVRVRADGPDAVLGVVDDGPGIPASLRPHLFERFARGDSSRSRAAGSTGLGLAIVHAVISAHAGTVAVESRPGQTVFTVRLPLAATPDGSRMDRRAGAGYPDRRDPMVFTVYEAGPAAGDSAMNP